jgi:acetate kinase
VTIFVLNAGSSTLKYGWFDDALRPLAQGTIDRRAVPDAHAAVAAALAAAPAGPVSVVGHRVVHGGTTYTDSVRVDASVRAELARLAELAPLHNPPALEALAAAEAALPGVAQVAVFDTAFFATLAPAQHVYPLPYSWTADWGVRRFGFHGISHAYCAGRAAELLGQPAPRLVICHLGNGCSATATRAGIAVDTTLGFTPLDGLMMGTRAGAVDPGILVHVQRHHGVTVDTLDRVLNHEAGLLGVSGVSSDFRRVEEAARAGDARASLALAIYAARVRSAIGALAVTLGGVDALVFTAGVGENAAELRAATCAGLECLGLRLDRTKNAACRADADIAEDTSAGRILVLHTQEELRIAGEARRVVGA